MKIETVAINDIKLFPNNPRKGNINLIAQSLESFGQYKPITVNKNTNEILVGNHTYQAAQALNWKTIDVVYVNVDEETAKKIVLIDNRAVDMGEYDNESLLEMLELLDTLENSGYNEEDFDSVIARLEEETTVNIKEAQEGTNIAEFGERFLTKDTKMLLVELENDDYIWAIDRLGQYRNTHNLSNNSEAIVKLMEEATNERAPQ